MLTFIMKNPTISDDAHEALYNNVRMVYSSLLIGNTVQGKGGDKEKEFEYTVTLTFEGLGEHQTYDYTKSDGTTGTIQSGDTFILKHGETMTIEDLPAGLTYTVTQTDYSSEEYVTNPTVLSHQGIIVEFEIAQAPFVNSKYLPGSLMITNSVEGNGSDPDKEFDYTVTFLGVDPNQSFTYTKSDSTTGTIQSGDKLLLKHGQKVTIVGIPKDTGYTVTQEDYTADGYTTNPESREYTGTIIEAETAEAPYVNARYLPGTLALEPETQKVRGDGKTPAELTATLTGTDGSPVKDVEITFEAEDEDGHVVVIGAGQTDEDGKVTINYTPPIVKDTTPKEYKITASTTATSPSGVPYHKAEAEVIAMPAALTGVLRNNTTGEIIPNADIIVKNVKTGDEEIITTDKDGKYYHPVQRDEEYTITYEKMVNVGGIPTPVPFTQKAIIEDTNPTTEGELIPAEITAVGIVLFKQPNGNTSLLNNDFSDNLRIYLKDANGDYLEDNNGAPKAFPFGPKGTFSVEGLTMGSYTMEVRYESESGEELALFGERELIVAANGELNISEELVDPYGIVYDENTLAPIEGAKVMLHYADTPRNIGKGITPNEEVVLPAIPGFAPNDNASPFQYSDATGFYAYMVYPEADYYLVVTKDGYERYMSPIISVEWDIVEHDVPMKLVSVGGGSGGSPGGSGNTPGSDEDSGDSSRDPGDNAEPRDDLEDPVDNSESEGIPESEEIPEDAKAIPEPKAAPDVPRDSPESVGNNEPSEQRQVDEGMDELNRQNAIDPETDAREASKDKKLDNVPKTGDDSRSIYFYLVLALLSLITLVFSLRNNKQKNQI